jgi:ribosome-associated protein
MREVPIRDDAIRLGQFLKLAGVGGTGGDIKDLVGAGEVRVNGEVDLRRGRQLRRGDVVAVGGDTIRVG